MAPVELIRLELSKVANYEIYHLCTNTVVATYLPLRPILLLSKLSSRSLVTHLDMKFHVQSSNFLS